MVEEKRDAHAEELGPAQVTFYKNIPNLIVFVL